MLIEEFSALEKVLMMMMMMMMMMSMLFAECRLTLEKDMRQCYTDLKLDPKLFVSPSNDGAILGKSSYAVSDFCE